MADEEKKNSKRQTRQYLKTLTKESSGRLRSRTRVVKYGAIGFGRNIWLSIASTLVMTITLLILFSTVFSNVILNETATSMRDKIDITVFIKPETEKETLEKLSDILKENDNVKNESIITNTSEDELNLFIEENSENSELIETLSDDEMKNIMLKTMQSTIRFKVYDPDNLDSLKSTIEENDLFSEYLDPEKEPTYDMNQAEIATISSWANIAKNGGLILGAVFLAISVLFIFNTIRMAIFSRREEINMMKLVGADRSFIRGPFLVEARLSGAIAGIISATLSYFGFNFIEPTLTSYGINISKFAQFFNSSWTVALFVIMIFIGILIGSISARLALKKYLRKL